MKGTKVFVHGIKEHNSEDVIEFEWTHNGNAVKVRVEFSESFTNGLLMGELDLQ